MVTARCQGTNDKEVPCGGRSAAVLGLEVVDGRLTDLRHGSGKAIPREVIAVAPRFVARSPGR